MASTRGVDRRRGPLLRTLRAFGFSVLALVLVTVLVPVLIVLDSYRIVRDVRPLARKTPDRTAVMTQRLADPRTPRSLRYRPIGLGAISPHLVHAVIVHEDATFYQHQGFDEFEIRAALRRSIAERQLGRGASTITTQLARTLYLGTGRSFLRKAREIPLTVRLERALPKQRILELYLNTVEWGPGVFGAEAASRHHFGVSARELTPAQAALLVAALPSPRRSKPARPSSYLRRRASIILTRMGARGWLSPEGVDAGRVELGFESRMAAASAPPESVAADSLAEMEFEFGPEGEPEVEAPTDTASAAPAASAVTIDSFVEPALPPAALPDSAAPLPYPADPDSAPFPEPAPEPAPPPPPGTP